MAKISVRQLATFAVDELESGVSAADVAKKLASYLLDARESRELPRVMRAVEAELNARGQSQVEITSAHAVSDDVANELAQLLGVENPVFHNTVDASVIGGVKAKSGEREIDLTVRNKLQRFNAAIARSN